jgi:hypothetical protein
MGQPNAGLVITSSLGFGQYGGVLVMQELLHLVLQHL